MMTFSDKTGWADAPVSIIIIALLVMGALSSILDSDPFWFLVAIWSIIIASLLFFTHGQSKVTAQCLLILVTIPFILMFMAGPLNLDLSNISIAFIYISEILSLFILCLVSLIVINTRSSVRMNRSSFIGFMFLFFEAVTAMQGPIDYYGDQWLGVDHLPNNTDLMIYIIVSTIGCVALLLVLNFIVEKVSLRDIERKVVGR
jgi:hypothetical protein